MKVFVLGNSHANLFSNTAPQVTDKINDTKLFKTCSIGPVIAYNFQEHHLPKVPVMLAVGEVDCRWHLPKQAVEQKRSYCEVVKECVNRFFPCLLEIRKTNEVISWGSHLTCPEEHNDDPSNPVYGPRDKRDICSLWWDSHMRDLATKYKIPHISINYELSKNREKYFMDYCHLNQEAYKIAEGKMCHLFN
jgi:hypothetical protein